MRYSGLVRRVCPIGCGYPRHAVYPGGSKVSTRDITSTNQLLRRAGRGPNTEHLDSGRILIGDWRNFEAVLIGSLAKHGQVLRRLTAAVTRPPPKADDLKPASSAAPVHRLVLSPLSLKIFPQFSKALSYSSRIRFELMSPFVQYGHPQGFLPFASG